MSETFGVWELRSLLGHNELGDTHLAIRSSDGSAAIIKRIRRDSNDERLTEALRQELALAAKLQHPAAARILEQGEIDGVAYVALEYVEGLSLARLCAAAQATHAWPLPLSRAAAIMKPVLDALAAAHALNPPLLHRDVVPENVRLGPSGRTVLTDFGLGRARLRAGGGATLRRAYVSPEQARGHATDARSEVFAAGLMLFELVCGRLPAQGGPGEVISRIATGELDAPLAVHPTLDPAVVPVLTRALAVRPEERFASAAELSAALAPWAAPVAGDEPLGVWAGKLALVKLPEAPPAPKPKAAAAPLVPASPVEAAKTPPTAPSPWKARGIAIGLSAVLALAVTVFVDVRGLFGTAAIDPKTARPLELVTIPSGAQVYIDGFPEERRTPMTLYLAKDELRNLVVKKPGIGAWSGVVYNSRRLEITLATGAVEEQRYEGGRPAPKATPPPPTVPVPPDAPVTPQGPVREVVFDVESPPIDTVLTAAHSVRADLGPELVLASGVPLRLGEGLTLYSPPFNQQLGHNPNMGTAQSKNGTYRNPKLAAPAQNFAGNHGGANGTYRLLNLFALHVEGGTAMVSDLSAPMTTVFPGKYYLFTPAENGDLHRDDAYVQIDDAALPLTARHLLHVEAIDSFLVRVLSPKVRYRLEVSRADGSSAPLPPLIFSMRPDTDPTRKPTDSTETSIRYDGAPVPSGQVLVGAGVHSFTGARSGWFTLITADGIAPADVKLSIKPMQGLMDRSQKRK